MLTRIAIGNRLRWLLLGLSLIGSGLISMGLIGLSVSGVILGILGAVLIYRGIQFMERPWTDVFPLTYFMCGLLGYFFTYFLYQNMLSLHLYMVWVKWFGMFYLGVVLFVCNLAFLKSITLKVGQGSALPKSLIRMNRTTVAVILLIIFTIGGFTTLKTLLQKAIYAIIYLIVWFIRLFPSSQKIPYTPAGKQPKPTAAPVIPHQQNLFEKILDFLFYASFVVIVIVILIIVYLALEKWLRKVYAWFKKILLSLLKRGDYAAQPSGFIDEKASLGIWRELTKSYGDRLKDWLGRIMEKEPKWDDLSNNKERVRYLYRHWLLERIAAGYTFKSSLTPKETGQDISQWDRKAGPQSQEMISLYDKARYGDHEIDDKEVEKIKLK